jgi:hypothetical protein
MGLLDENSWTKLPHGQVRHIDPTSQVMHAVSVR